MRAIVTGASSGIGKAIYEGLKAEDYWEEVIGISRRGPDIKMDLSKPLRLIDVAHFPDMKAITLFVNAAGIMPLPEGGDAQLEQIMNVNFWAPYRLMRALHAFDKFIMGSCIINIASVSADRPDKDLPIYAASKAALIAMSKAYAKKWAPDIRVNCISPGFFDTNLVPGDTPQHLIDEVPMGYEEDPNCLVELIGTIFNNQYMTGANIVVDGGLSI